jgi:hypothetical protein
MAYALLLQEVVVNWYGLFGMREWNTMSNQTIKS